MYISPGRRPIKGIFPASNINPPIRKIAAPNIIRILPKEPNSPKKTPPFAIDS